MALDGGDVASMQQQQGLWYLDKVLVLSILRVTVRVRVSVRVRVRIRITIRVRVRVN